MDKNILKAEIFNQLEMEDLLKKEESVRMTLLMNPNDIDMLSELAILLYHKGDVKVGKLSNSQLKALDELLFDYVSIDHKIAVRKLEISDVPNIDENVGGGRTNIVSKPTENLVAKWDSDQRLNSLYAQKHAVESTLSTLDEDMTQIFWLRWSRGSVNTWEEIADKMAYDRSTIYRRRQRILEIFADFYGFC